MEQYIEKIIHAIGIAIALIIAACLKPVIDYFKSNKQTNESPEMYVTQIQLAATRSQIYTDISNEIKCVKSEMATKESLENMKENFEDLKKNINEMQKDIKSMNENVIVLTTLLERRKEPRE